MKGEFMIRNKARLVAQGYTQEKGLTMMKSLALKFGFKKSSLCSTPRKLKSPLLKDEDGEEVDVIKAKKSVKLMMEKLFRMELELMLVTQSEGLAIPTDPHHTPTFTQPSTQPQKTQQPRKPKRKDTQVPQPSDPIENVADVAVHKDLGDSLVRAATTASSLEAEQDSGNINKTQSKATPSESSSLGTTLGGGPRCQKTIGDVGYWKS
ncbi:hypothetical protein Tco_1405353 [Tanacetum coccineum]